MKGEDILKYIIGVNKLAEELGISRETLYRYMKKGLPYHCISERKRGFDLEEVKIWLKGKAEERETLH